MTSEVIQGLIHIHNMGYVHGHIKPGNVVFSEKCNSAWSNCHAKITDFSKSCNVFKPDDCNSMGGTSIYVFPEFNNMGGTLMYMSPELCSSGRRQRTDDVWALGVTLHRLLHNGKLPKILEDIWEEKEEKRHDDNWVLLKIADLKRVGWRYDRQSQIIREQPLERLLHGFLVAERRGRMSLEDSFQVLSEDAAAMSVILGKIYHRQSEETATTMFLYETPEAKLPGPCWEMCEAAKCFTIKPVVPCQLAKDGSHANCLRSEPEVQYVKPSATARSLELVIRRGADNGKLGLKIDPAKPNFVIRIVAGSAAAKAGLQVGDEIESIQGMTWKTLPAKHRKQIIDSETRIVLKVWRY
eukprot:gnl/MRDRNA2_/MRDRNA2_194780_c0_seq1.p1 gnl/MRDRNA2_/MRDRNA2_194780_c0~~gnl/MRDRNA2_/MRDRNA2_194780_c0_seq1.p1  ORF type:complete len:386 (-),score=40.03 gnl/MRDRNA2_/MRDRNA2_194780_c0_seq1:10-1071(-)